MDILVTNDDGLFSDGIAVLAEVAARLGTAWTVAPAEEQSSKGHGFTLYEPLMVEAHGERRWSVSGTPADCAYTAIHGILPVKPSLCLSGINHGSNIGCDVHYSGTVAAAMEACFQGVPAIAVSMAAGKDKGFTHFETAAHVVEIIAKQMLEHGFPRHVVLSINTPDVPLSELKGIRATTQGWRTFKPQVDMRESPRGQRYCWIGGPHAHFDPIPGSEGPLVAQGYATVTPLHTDMTHHALAESMKSWVDSEAPIG